MEFLGREEEKEEDQLVLYLGEGRNDSLVVYNL